MRAEAANNPRPKVLVVVRGGVAYSFSDPSVDVLLIDYDNDPEAVVPDEYAELLNESAND